MGNQTPVSLGYFESDVMSVDRPDTRPKDRPSFWEKDMPAIGDNGRIVRGGMFEHQRKWWELDSFVKVMVAGYGAGKTISGAKRIISSALDNAPAAVAAVSPTFPLARKTTIPTIEALLAGKRSLYGKQFWWKYNKALHYFTIKFHGRTGTIYILSGDEPNSLRGPNLAAAWLDEPFIMEKEVFFQMMARIRHPDAVSMEILLTGCVTRDSWVTTKQGMVRIGDIDPGTKPKQYKEISVDVLGIHNEYHKASKFFNNGIDDTIRMTLTNGYELEATPDHPVLCMGDDGVPVFRRMGSRKGKYGHLGQVRLGDYVAISRGADVWGNIDPTEGFAKHLSRVRKGWRRREYQNPLPSKLVMTNDLAYFLGLWVAEGSKVANKIGISCGDQEVTRKLCEEGVLGIKLPPTCNVTCAIASKELVELMRFLGMPLVLAPQKYIPQWVFSGKREWALHFLAGMYDGDGHVCKDGSGIGYSTTSERLAKDLQQLLLNLGVVSHRDKVWNAPTEKCKVWSLAHHVRASCANAKKLAQVIPLRIKRKREQLSFYVREMRDSDKIPFQRNLVLSVWEQRHKLSWRGGKSQLQPNKIIETIKKHSGAIAYSTLQDFLRRWFANERIPNSDVIQLRDNLRDGYYWAKVEKLEQGRAETVDFVIPDTHTFTPNGINSKQTPEQLNWGHELCMGDLKDDMEEFGDMKVGMVQASTRENLALSTSYVKRLEGTFTEKMAQAYIEGGFVNLSEGLVYYAFTVQDPDARRNNVRSFDGPDGKLTIPDGAELGCGMDFNVNPMSACVFWMLNNHVHIFREIELPNADTEYMCQVLREEFVEESRQTRQILHTIYPDASGSYRKTSAPGAKTDFHFIREAGFEIRAHHENPKRKDRYNAVNGKFRPKEGPTSLTIDPRCKHLVNYLQVYSHENMNKQQHMSHLLDSASYPIELLFPIIKSRSGIYKLTGA